MITIQPARAFVVGALVFGVVAATSCMTSPSPQLAPQAMTPYGETATVAVSRGRKFSGELLAVTDSSWILMVNYRVATVRNSGINYVFLKSIGFAGYSSPKSRPSEATLKRARGSARFPGGIPPEAMAALLAKSAQSAPDDLEKMPR